MSTFDLRPMNWSEILDRSFTLYRRTFFLLYLLQLLPAVVIWCGTILGQRSINSLTAVLQSGSPSFDEVMKHMAAAAIPITGLFVLGVMAASMQLGSMTLAVSRTLFDQPISLGEAYLGAFHRLPSLVVALLLSGLAMVGGALFCCVPGIILALLFYVVVPTIVIDGAGGFAALGRSWELMTHRTPDSMHPLVKAGIIGFLVFALQMVVGFVASLPNTLVTMGFMLSAAGGGAPPDPTMFSQGVPFLVVTITSFFATLINSVVPPFTAIATVLLFYDLKMRRDGFDLRGETEPVL